MLGRFGSVSQKGTSKSDTVVIRQTLSRALAMADIEDVERDFIMETMEPFIGDHHPKVLANRMDQNRILDDLDELVAGLAEFQQGARLVLVRSRFTSGQRKHKPGEMGEMEGTQATHYGDPTGEAAAWNADAGSDGAEMVDAIAKTIAG